jgi:hypothetical protein
MGRRKRTYHDILRAVERGGVEEVARMAKRKLFSRMQLHRALRELREEGSEKADEFESWLRGEYLGKRGPRVPSIGDTRRYSVQRSKDGKQHLRVPLDTYADMSEEDCLVSFGPRFLTIQLP